MSGCASLHLLPPAARGRLSNDNWIRHQPRNIPEYHEESIHFADFFSIPVWFYPRSLAIRSFVTGHPNNAGHGWFLWCWPQIKTDTGYLLPQVLHYRSPAHLAAKTGWRLNVLWLGWCSRQCLHKKTREISC